MKDPRKWTTLLALSMLLPAAALAAEQPAATSRIMVTINHLKPGRGDEWSKAIKDTVTPALKKAGISWYTVSEQIFGDRPVFTTIRPLEKFAELDGPGALERAGLSEKQRDAFSAVADDSIVSQRRFIASNLTEFAVPATGPVPIQVLLVLRPNPGQGAALQALLRTEVLPVMRQAKQAGKIASWGVATTGQGNPGLTVTSTGYANLAALDAGNVLSQAMGASAYAQFQTRMAQLAVVEDSIVNRWVADLSYAPAN
jgi:hypothetical protein